MQGLEQGGEEAREEEASGEEARGEEGRWEEARGVLFFLSRGLDCLMARPRLAMGEGSGMAPSPQMTTEAKGAPRIEPGAC